MERLKKVLEQRWNTIHAYLLSVLDGALLLEDGLVAGVALGHVARVALLLVLGHELGVVERFALLLVLGAALLL